MLSSNILPVIFAKDMPAQQFEATKDLLRKAKIHNIERKQRTLILYAIKLWYFKFFYCQFWPLGNLQEFV